MFIFKEHFYKKDGRVGHIICLFNDHVMIYTHSWKWNKPFLKIAKPHNIAYPGFEFSGGPIHMLVTF